MAAADLTLINTECVMEMWYDTTGISSYTLTKGANGQCILSFDGKHVLRSTLITRATEYGTSSAVTDDDWDLKRKSYWNYKPQKTGSSALNRTWTVEAGKVTGGTGRVLLNDFFANDQYNKFTLTTPPAPQRTELICNNCKKPGKHTFTYRTRYEMRFTGGSGYSFAADWRQVNTYSYSSEGNITTNISPSNIKMNFDRTDTTPKKVRFDVNTVSGFSQTALLTVRTDSLVSPDGLSITNPKPGSPTITMIMSGIEPVKFNQAPKRVQLKAGLNDWHHEMTVTPQSIPSPGNHKYNIWFNLKLD